MESILTKNYGRFDCGCAFMGSGERGLISTECLEGPCRRDLVGDTKQCTGSRGSIDDDDTGFLACILMLVVSDYRSRGPIYTPRVRQCGQLN